MIRLNALLIVCLLLNHQLRGQTQPFARTFTPGDVTTFSDAIQLADGRYMLLNDRNVLLVDAEGWQLSRTHLVNNDMIFGQAIANLSQEAALVSTYNYSSEQVELYRITDNGDVSMIRKISALPGQHTFIGRDTLLIVGRDNDIGFADMYSCLTGKQLWSFRAGSPGVDYIGSKKMGDQIAVFGRKSGYPYGQAVVSMLNLEGDELWTKTFSGSSHLTITDIDYNGETFAAILWDGKTADVVSLDQDGETITTVHLSASTPRYIRSDGHGNFIILGVRSDRIFLTKVDRTLKNVWFRYYGTGVPSEFGDTPKGFRVLDDGSIALWGNIYWDYGTHGFLVVTGNDGTIPMGTPANLVRSMDPLKLERSSNESEPALHKAAFDGSDLFVGGSFTTRVNENDSKIGFSARVNSLDTVWTKRFHPTSLNASVNISDVYLSDNQDVYFLSRGNGTYLHRFNKNGTQLSSFQVPIGRRSDMIEYSPEKFLIVSHSFDLQPYNEVGSIWLADLTQESCVDTGTRLVGSMIHHVNRLPNGNFVVTGETAEPYTAARKLFWAAIKEDGSVVNSKAMDINYKLLINRQKLLDNGHVLCVGSFEHFNGDKDALMIELDESGNIIWLERLNILDRDQAWDVIKLDNGYAVVGECGSPVFGLQQSFGFVMFLADDRTRWGITYYGEPGFYASIKHIFDEGNGKLLLVGNAERKPDQAFKFKSEIFTERIDIPAITSIESPSFEVSVSPNPFIDRIKIECPERCSATLLSIDGRILKSESNVLSTDIDCSGFSDGLYLLRVSSENKTTTKRLVKMKR